MTKSLKEKKWFRPLLDFDDESPKKKFREDKKSRELKRVSTSPPKENIKFMFNLNSENWLKNFDPVTVEDLAVNNKKVQEVEQWMLSVSGKICGDMLLLTGPVGSGKTITVQILAKKHNFKVTEWITPVDLEVPSENGNFEFKERQAARFQGFIISAANYCSLLDNNSKKLVVVEDFPNTFMRTPSEFTEVLQQFKMKAKSPIIFICSETHTNSRNTFMSLFTPSLKDQFNMHHISFNAVSATGLKSALKRASDIMSKKYSSCYKNSTMELIDCVVNSSGGDVRSAVLNFHFACLKGSHNNLETSQIIEETKSKGTKRKKTTSKFISIGKDQTVSIMHGVGRVLNPKWINEGTTQKLTHLPSDIIEQFLSQPMSFINFLGENYLPHFSCIEDAEKAACALSDADYLLAEWRDQGCQEHGLYVATTGLMLANKTPVSAWNPVRGPKNMNIQFPSASDFPVLDSNILYNGRVLVSDFKTYCNIINKAL